jgi:hypothetical protein
VSEPQPLPVPPRFYCAAHGKTNSVIDLFKGTYCLDCLRECAEAHCAPVFKLTDIVPQTQEPA